MKNNIKVVIFYVVLIAVILLAASYFMGNFNQQTITYGEIVELFDEEQVKSCTITEDDELQIELRDNKGIVTKQLRDIGIFYNDLQEIILEQYREGIIEYYEIEPVTQTPWWVSMLPYAVVIVLFAVIWFYAMNQATGRGGKIANFGKARVKMGADEKNKVFFSDVAGADEEKAELEEVVAFLKNPEKFTKLGAKIPHGVLLVGPPGTGKTLLAKAVAGEAGVPFYSISGSDFVEMYVGVGASRVRDLFETAKKNPASIVFIDEIDAVGRHRGAGLGGGHDEREQTLNQLLVEMDGFGGNSGVIVIAATNRPDILDPALLRPGRFDRQVTVNYPDLKGREDILKVHSRNKPLENNVDLKKIAQLTVGYTGADLANLLNEAALLAARKGKSLIGMNDIEESELKLMVGTHKKTMKLSEQEKLKTAYHEAGHAIIAHVLPSIDPVRQISIIPSGKALGYTLNPPVEDKYSVYKSGIKEQIAMLLGGRAAEKIIFDDISGGASNDIQRATELARKMITKLGMSDLLGPINFGGEHNDDEVFLGRDFNQTKNYSEDTAAKIDGEIEKVILEAYENAQNILKENIEKLHFIAKYLAKNELMDDEQFKVVMERETLPTFEDLEKIAEDKKKKSEEENNKAMETQRANENNSAKTAYNPNASFSSETQTEIKIEQISTDGINDKAADKTSFHETTENKDAVSSSESKDKTSENTVATTEKEEENTDSSEEKENKND